MSEFPLHMAKTQATSTLTSTEQELMAVASCSTAIQQAQESDTSKIVLATSPGKKEIEAKGVKRKATNNKATSSLTSTEQELMAVASCSTAIQQAQESDTPKIVLATSPGKKEIEDKGVKRKATNNEEWTPRKKKLLDRLTKTKCTIKSLRKSSVLLEKIESPVLRELIINSCKNEKRKPKARRWTTKHKLSCLAILKRSQKTYRYLSAAVTLPTIKTLQSILKKIPMKPGISQAVLSHLKTIADGMDEKDRVCSLAFDEMAIKSRVIYNEANDLVEGYEDLGEMGRTNELADHALVFLLQGLRRKRKQPIAFYFTKGTISSAKLATIIKNIILDVTACGFTVLNTVCDQGPTNMGALKLLRDTLGPSQDGSNHYFQVDGKNIYIVYDIPHLFKSIRNNFMQAGSMVLNKKIGKWEHFVEMETHNRNFLYLNKITEAHINPKYKAKMRVKLAAQLLSNTVSAVLKLLARAETGDKSNDLLNTAHIVEELDQLFDSTNGPSGPNDIKKTKRENVSEKSNHMDRWAHYIKTLTETKFINKHGVESKHVKCIQGYIISLKSLRDIWTTVNKMGFKYLNLRNLNQDALENLFGVIRQHSPTNRHPTASHFIAALKTAVVTGLTAPHSRGANCENDNKQLLTDFHYFIFGEQKSNDDVETTTHTIQTGKENKEIPCENENEIYTLELPDIDEEEVDETDFSVIAQQPTVYVAGYLARHILKKIHCDECKSNLTVTNPGDNPMYTYILLREWWQNKFSLTYPSLNFCKTIQTLIATTETELLPLLHKPNICLLGCTLFTVGNRDACFVCSIHGQDISKLCYELTCKLLIRRQCQRINESLSAKEEDLASVNKRAEQQGKAK